MRLIPCRRVIFAVLAGLSVALTGACSGTIEDKLDEYLPKREAKYKSSRSLPPLEVPPDLSSAAINDSLPVPEGQSSGSATYSEYASGGTTQTVAASNRVLPQLDNIRIERSGDKRWLVVNATPAQVWPRLRDFWIEQGFLINLEDPSIGIMETDWAEQRAEFKGSFIKEMLNKLNDALYGAVTRDKFRTRLERGAEPGTTEIFVSHRGAEEVSTGKITRAQDDTGSRDELRVWQPRPADPELEAEMLNRMLVAFGVDEQRAAGMIAQTRDKRDRSKMVRDQNGIKGLALDESFSRAWRRTGLALDRVGFTVEDRDRSRGLYFVRYVDPDTDIRGKKEGFFSKLKFWGDDDKADRDDGYLISLIGGKDGDETTQVVILNKRGEPESGDTADRILGLLHEQLK